MDEEKTTMNDVAIISQQLETANDDMLNTFVEQHHKDDRERVFKITKIVNDYDNESRRVAIDRIIFGLSTVTFLACSFLAAKEIGYCIDPTSYKDQVDNVFQNISSNHIIGTFQEIANYICVNIGAFNEAAKNVVTFENLKNLFTELGPAGYVSAFMMAVSGRNIGNSNIDKLRSDYEAAEVAYPNEVQNAREDLFHNSIAGRFVDGVREDMGIAYNGMQSVSYNIRSAIAIFRGQNIRELNEYNENQMENIDENYNSNGRRI